MQSRFKAGTAHPSAKLTDAQVVEIRERYVAGESQRSLAATFGITPQSVARITSGRAWKHVGGPVGVVLGEERMRAQARARHAAGVERRQGKRALREAAKAERAAVMAAAAAAVMASLVEPVTSARRRVALRQLRDLGLTLQQIGDLFGFTRQWAWLELNSTPSPAPPALFIPPVFDGTGRFSMPGTGLAAGTGAGRDRGACTGR